jgi:iron(III) transport system ATP-binding protein
MLMPGGIEEANDAGLRMAQSARPFVRVENLSKSFGSFQALKSVSFSIAAGDGLALLGPSGCGKTTILRCIAGLETPDTGLIEIDGRIVFDAVRGIDLAPEKRDLGIVFQSYAIWPHMTVGENVGMPLKVRRVSKAEIDSRVEEALTLVGLEGWQERSAMALSGGQQQRVALARAIVHQPRLVLFDEPMSNLDTQLREDMRMDLRRLQERIGFTSVYVTHDHGEAFALARNVLVMNRGNVEMQGHPDEVYFTPCTPFVAKFFGYNILSGVMTDGDDVEFAPSLRLRVAPNKLAAGMRVHVCMRKEDVIFSETDGLPCEILTQIFQGSHDEILLRCGGVFDLRAHWAPRHPISKSCRITIAPERCIVIAAN